MKLVCPHCSKVVDVADTLAGQTTNCPQCEGPFTVPLAPPTPVISPSTVAPPPGPVPPPPPSPPPPDPLGQTTDWRADQGHAVVPPPLPPRRLGGIARFLPRFQELRIPPAVRDWLGVVALTVLFILMFFSWVSISAGDTRIITQSGAGIAFGTVQGEEAARMMFRDLGFSPLLVLYFLCGLAGLILLIVLILERFSEAPALASIRLTLRRIAALRDTIVTALLVATALILLLYLLVLSFPIAQLMQTDKAAGVMKYGLTSKVTPEITGISSYEMVYLQWMSRHFWFYLAVLINVIAAIDALLRWLRHHGHIRRWPRLALEWDDGQAPANSPQLTFDTPMRASDLTAPAERH